MEDGLTRDDLLQYTETIIKNIGKSNRSEFILNLIELSCPGITLEEMHDNLEKASEYAY